MLIENRGMNFERLRGAKLANDADLLQAKLIGILGRMVSVEEMRKSLGLAVSTYYDQVKEHRLITGENLAEAARNLGINHVYLMVECGLIERAAMDEYLRYDGKPPQLSNVRKVRRSRADAPDL